MGNIMMKKITKRSCYQVVSILIFCGAILAVLNTELILGYVLIVIGYFFMRKSDLEN